MKKFNYFSLFTVIFLVSLDCAPITSDMQSAKTTGKGGIELTVNTGSLDYDDSDGNSMSEAQDNFGAHIAYGLGHKVDIRGRFENINVNSLNSLAESGEEVDITLFSIGIKYGVIKDKLALYLPYDIYYSDGESGPETLAPTLIYTKTFKEGFEVNPSAKWIMPMNEETDSDPGLAINLGLGVNPGSLLKKVEFERTMLRAEYGLYLPIDSEGDAWFSHTTFGLTYRIK
tara:strand:- start:19 stop:705 length:687 start_codon:yes stop_codon:yes gene_type:complete